MIFRTLLNLTILATGYAFQLGKVATPSTIIQPSTTSLHANQNEPATQSPSFPTILASTLIFTLSTLTPLSPSHAVSGGGLDYAGLDITGQDFSNANYKGKDFTQTIAKGTKFMNSNLQGCRFYKAFLVNTNFEGADLRGSSLEDTSMDGANLKGVNAAGAYFSASLVDVETMVDGDFTDASIPPKTLTKVCLRDDVKGTNPVTGVDTRDSLMCL